MKIIGLHGDQASSSGRGRDPCSRPNRSPPHQLHSALDPPSEDRLGWPFFQISRNTQPSKTYHVHACLITLLRRDRAIQAVFSSPFLQDKNRAQRNHIATRTSGVKGGGEKSFTIKSMENKRLYLVHPLREKKRYRMEGQAGTNAVPSNEFCSRAEGLRTTIDRYSSSNAVNRLNRKKVSAYIVRDESREGVEVEGPYRSDRLHAQSR